MIVNLPWDRRLGASRVWMELGEQWVGAGHFVEKYCMTDAFPDVPSSGPGHVFRQLLFPFKALSYVRANAKRFDVIDALLGTLPFSRSRLGFAGIVVARSVGFPHLYENFASLARARWPQAEQGKLFGKLFYRIARRLLLRNSSQSLARCDLINLPNQDELTFVRDEMRSLKPAFVQPYGLTEQARLSLQQSALAPETRLHKQLVSFIGMWSPRKGGKDWASLVVKVRQRCPATTFRFLGTMADRETVLRDLPAGASDYVELIPQYRPDELARLLSDATVGAFPSYVEGFGFAVLEQLAASVPVVAYDSPGPREMLRSTLDELLVPAGDVDAMAATLCGILSADLAPYNLLCQRCVSAAKAFEWERIARETICKYQNLHQGHRETMTLFVQPFGLGGAGGGPRILRALLQQAPTRWHSVCVSPEAPQPFANESHLPLRPQWGRIERSRLAWLPRLSQPLYARRFKRSLKKLSIEAGATALHAVPHAGLDFAYTQSVARDLKLRFYLNLHDDLAYSSVGSLTERACHKTMATSWTNADVRFVISRELGEEYGQSFGAQKYHVVTDGLEKVATRSNPRSPHLLRIYFMGLFHLSYERNLEALDQGLTMLQQQSATLNTRIVCRCGMIREKVLQQCKSDIRVLPFASESQVEEDFNQADLVYLPLPFGKEYARFTQFSLSTKMVTYLGCGLPILYHGPPTSAAYNFLSDPPAALLLTTLDPKIISSELRNFLSKDRESAAVVQNAANLARRSFMLDRQRSVFWGAMEHLS